MEYDIFICHASEDKQDFVKPLAGLLVQEQLRVWYDDFELTLGDSLREKIDYGLANSRYGAVVLSESFFGKKWPKDELDGLVARQTSEGKKVILPIWHNVGFDEVKKFSPMLAGKLAARSEEGLEAVVAQILAVCNVEPTSQGPSVFQTTTESPLRVKCLELIRKDDIIAWRQLVEKLTNETIEKLSAWKQIGEQAMSKLRQLPPDKQGWKEAWEAAVSEAVKFSVPGFVPILTAIQAVKLDYWNESVSFLRALILLYRNMVGGTRAVSEISNDILYVAGSVGMALAARTKQLSFIDSWANLTMPQPEGSGETVWCQAPEMNYWQTGITGHNNAPYGFFVQLLELDDIRPFFDTDERLRQSLFLGNLLLSLIDFRNSASQPDYNQTLKSEHWHPNVMPIWCLMKPTDFRYVVWGIFGSSADAINFAYPGLMPSPDKFWPLWQTWKVRCAQFMSDAGRYHRHLHNIHFLNLPGEPAINR
jgi:hypothetical protein